LEAEDNDRSNRDWACLLLSQQDVDTDEVRNALMAAASDGDQYVRAEAILGLAQRSTELATPFVQAALSETECALQIFEAAALIADPILVGLLSHWAESSDNEFLDNLVLQALTACQSANPNAR
jgi:HEAT repeats